MQRIAHASLYLLFIKFTEVFIHRLRRKNPIRVLLKQQCARNFLSRLYILKTAEIFIGKRKDAHNPLRQRAVSIATPSRLRNGGKSRERAVDDGERHIHTRFDELGTDANKPPLRMFFAAPEFLSYFCEDFLAMCGAHLRAQVHRANLYIRVLNELGYRLVEFSRLLREVHNAEHIAFFLRAPANRRGNIFHGAASVSAAIFDAHASECLEHFRYIRCQLGVLPRINWEIQLFQRRLRRRTQHRRRPAEILEKIDC